MLDTAEQPPQTPPQSSLRQRLARPVWAAAGWIGRLAYRIEFGRPFLTYREDGTRCVITKITLSQG